jgi:flagellar hook-length control protein FliK
MTSSAETLLMPDVNTEIEGLSLVTPTGLNQNITSSILATPINMRQPQWTQDVAQRVQVMINKSMNELEVRLDPLGLGPMKIGLKLDEHHRAHVTFSAQHGLTREMLENAIPRLKDMLALEGIELASSTVNSGDSQTGNEQHNEQSSNKYASDLSEDADKSLAGTIVLPSSDYLVDQFA